MRKPSWSKPGKSAYHVLFNQDCGNIFYVTRESSCGLPPGTKRQSLRSLTRTMRNVPLVVLAGTLFFGMGCERVPRGGRESAPAPETRSEKGADHGEVEYALRIPARILTPEMVALIRKGRPYSDMFRYHFGPGQQEGARKWYENIPASRWKELISPFAPVTVYGTFRGMRGGKCPFCGKPYKGCAMTADEFIRTPFQARTTCCGQTVYAREENMPPDYQARPNHTERIPHLDGTEYPYRFYVPPGSENNRTNWFCSAGEVWAERLTFIPIILSECGAAACFDNDEKAVVYAAEIFDRLADVYPGLPLYDREGFGHGFARGRDGKSYLTRDEYLSEERPRRFGKPFWYRPDNYQFDKLRSPASGWQDGVMFLAGLLAQSFDAVRDTPAVKAWSEARYGRADAFEKRVMERLFEETRLLCNSIPDSGHNTIDAWINGAFKLGVLLKDPYFVEAAVRLLESYIVNNYFSDGLSVEGAFDYAVMTRSVIENMWATEQFAGVHLDGKYPFLKRIREVGDFPIQTLFNIESMHGDEHGMFFASCFAGRYSWLAELYPPPPPKPDKVDYAGHEISLCFPETGISCLRGGAPGSRLEAIMDFQSAAGHTHSGKLNLQLFYEGVNLLPDMGYGTLAADLSKAPYLGYKHNFELLPNPDPTDWSFPWRRMYTTHPQAHCTALVDGVNHKDGPCTFHRFLGGQAWREPGYQVQFLEADARGVFKIKGPALKGGGYIPRPQPTGEVSRFRRQIATLTLGNGRSLVLDVFRIRGGLTHEVYWHVPAEPPESSLGPAGKLEQGTILDYMRAVHAHHKLTEPGQGASEAMRLGTVSNSALQFLNGPKRWAMPDGMWKMEWAVSPSKFAPVTPKGKELYAAWDRLLHDVKLRVWGGALGNDTVQREILNARGPWVSKIMETRDGIHAAFKDALDYLIVLRRAEQAPLESTFVHVLEPYTPDQGSVLEKAEMLSADKDSGPEGCGVRLTVRDGRAEKQAKQVMVATTLDEGKFSSGDFCLDGRLGVICRDDLSLTLYDGTQLYAGDFGVSLEPGWRLKLLDVVGDLTGRPDESALIVSSDQPLPTDGTLVGQMLTVYHQISDIHTSGYTIDRVRRLRGRQYRIDLRWQPPFIQNSMFVREIGKDDRRYVYGTVWLHKGSSQGLYRGRRARFPRAGFSCGIVDAPHYIRGSLLDDLIELDTMPPEGAIQLGDAFVVYTIQPGDTVVIPSHFAARAQRVATEDNLELDICATGTAELLLPPGWEPKSMVSSGKSVRLRCGRKERQWVVTIDPEDIKDGRARLTLCKRPFTD